MRYASRMEKVEFRVLIKRLPVNIPLVSLRFEMSDGYGELFVGDGRPAPPSPSGEIAEATGEQLRAGRFVHVFPSGRKRQSYSFSHIDDDRIQQLEADRWIELTAATEFGLRYLDLTATSAAPAQATAAVRVTASPVPPREATSSGVTSSPPGHTPSPTPRRQGPTTLPPPEMRSVQPSLTEDAVRRLPIEAVRAHLLQEMATTVTLGRRVADLERDLRLSQQRERDLLEILTRWQTRN
jgi:hypothetical protein